MTYTSNAGYVGADSFMYVVADNQGRESAPATVTVTVNAAPPAPPVNPPANPPAGGGGSGGGGGGGGGAIDLLLLAMLGVTLAANLPRRRRRAVDAMEAGHAG